MYVKPAKHNKVILIIDKNTSALKLNKAVDNSIAML